MREQAITISRLKIISAMEAIGLAFMLGLILYLMQAARQSTPAIIVPTLTSKAHATVLPNASSRPTIDTQAPIVKLHPASKSV